MDPLSFPVLAASVLTQAIGFLYNRAGAIIDRRASRRESEQVPSPDEKNALSGEIRPLRINEDEMTPERIELVATLSDGLGVYKENPDVISAEDERLRRTLGKLRRELEIIYGQHFTFIGEEQERPASGVSVKQKFDRVSGEAIGLEVDTVQGRANADVSQEANTVDAQARIVGAKINKLG